MTIKMLALPVPPLELGASWTGLSLLNWVVEQADREMKEKLIEMRDGVGGVQFRDLFNRKAAELNKRIADSANGRPLASAPLLIGPDGKALVN